MSDTLPAAASNLHFVRQIIAEDLKSNKYGGRVRTRFPPEPNGYLHIGHAKAICLDFGMALENGGQCHLRMDDTNPVKEEQEYIEAIQEDVRWLGFDWGPHFYYASDYFGRMYDCAEQLIKMGKAYVCELSADAWKEYRGVPTRPGKESPSRNRSAEENLDLFARMRKGEFPDGSRVLRAKIDMASPNIHMRDPVLYRILHASHPHTGDQWCLYPTYDFAHCLEDSFESITHSICTLEFEVHRPLYDWILETLGLYRPQQIEFARLNLSYTVMSKRKLLDLVREGKVNGWDDPRMPTIGGLRRRGYTPEAIRAFCELIGVTKFNSLTDVALLEHCVREDLNKRVNRVLGVVRPLKLIIENYPEDGEETFEAVNNPEDPVAGTRRIPFSRELYIERDDFMENPPKKFFRLAPGQEVRLRYACLVTCTGVEKNAAGEVVAVRCTYDPNSRGGTSPDGRKVKGTIHWVSARHAVAAEIRLYDRLFTLENLADLPEDRDFREFLNPAALTVVNGWVEPGLASVPAGQRCQFERVGYFTADPDSKPGAPVFNRTVTLKDSYKAAAAGAKA
ncbi:MAG: glutamine--tRNA ligase/YqeY domain fusion protein [Kiritimatiellia bacterium]